MKLSAHSFERMASFLCLLSLLYARGETAENRRHMFALDLIDNPDELIVLTFVRSLRKRG